MIKLVPTCTFLSTQVGPLRAYVLLGVIELSTWIFPTTEIGDSTGDTMLRFFEFFSLNL